ncbi:MAG: class I tRNA ligase family protein, partial [Sphingomicrobium sp.]
MSDAPTKPDYRYTVFLPKTDFPMKAGLPQKEPVILARWQEQDLYGQVRKSRAGRAKFILHDGPPYANGDIHIGHALDRTLKDMVVRTQTLLGKDAPFMPGWDCHGLPIEWKIEEQYRKKKLDKDQVPLVEFRAECRAYAQHWVDVQREQLKRLGTLADWDHPYLTMDYDAEATIVSELMKFAESGQVFRGARPVMWSPVEKTALAEAEIEYEDVVSTQIDVAFEILSAPNCRLIQDILDKGMGHQIRAVVWTTTPWTIPVNQAVAFNPDIEYALVGVSRKRTVDDPWEGPAPKPMSTYIGYLVLAANLIPELARRGALPDGFGLSFHIPVTFKGSEFDGATARHPMMGRVEGPRAEFFARDRPFLPGDFVTTDQGTGLVHMAPDHGVDDFELCKSVGIDPVFAVEADGKYRADWGWLG